MKQVLSLRVPTGGRQPAFEQPRDGVELNSVDLPDRAALLRVWVSIAPPPTAVVAEALLGREDTKALWDACGEVLGIPPEPEDVARLREENRRLRAKLVRLGEQLVELGQEAEAMAP